MVPDMPTVEKRSMVLCLGFRPETPCWVPAKSSFQNSQSGKANRCSVCRSLWRKAPLRFRWCPSGWAGFRAPNAISFNGGIASAEVAVCPESKRVTGFYHQT